MSTIIHATPQVFYLGILLGLTVISGTMARKFKVPDLVGYLCLGLLASVLISRVSPEGLDLPRLANIGAALLLFEIGVELDLRRIRRKYKSLLGKSLMQMLIGIIGGTSLFLATGIPVFGAMLLGISLSMSSSALILDLIKQRKGSKEVSTGESILRWNIAQNVIGVGFTIFIITIYQFSFFVSAKSIFGIAGIGFFAIIARSFLPKFLKYISWNVGLFLIAVIAFGITITGFGVLFLSIPLALAAFIAGLCLNQSRHVDDVSKVVLPLRGLFQAILFVSIGALVNFGLLGAAISFTFLLIFALVILKALPTFLLNYIQKGDEDPLKMSATLSQMGEFSFVLGSLALSVGDITEVQFTGLLLALILSLLLSSWSVHKMDSSSRSI